LVEVEGGQHQYAWRIGREPSQPPGCLDPIDARHAHVHQHDVGPQASRLVHRLGAVTGLTGHVQIRLGAQDQPKAGADQLLVVRQEQPDGHVVDPNGRRA
jgi:hypothetical protein